MRVTFSRVVSCLVLCLLGSPPARASCAEDLTRIQTALPKAPPDVQSRAATLVTEAENKAKAKDAAGCEAATKQALQLLHLPVLAPIQLSTPMAGPQEPSRTDKPSEAAKSPIRASTDPRSAGPQPGNASAAPAPAATPSPNAPAQAAGGANPPAQAAQAGPQQPASPPQLPPAQSGAPSTPQQPNPTGQAQAPSPPAMQAQSQPARQTPPQVAALPDQAPGATRQEGPSFLSTRDLIGTEVVDRDNPGRTLGRVASVIIDRDSGRARYVMLEWGGYLGWDRNRVLVPYNLLGFRGRWDRPTLQAPASKIENAPQLREQDLDALLQDPDWRRAVADYFGIAPGQGTQQAGAEPAGPRQAAQGATVASVSNPTGDVSDPKAQPGEGATGPTAGTGSRDAQTTTAMTSPSAQSSSPDQPHGQALAQRVCAACHTLNPGGATRVGPNLFGVADRPIASVSGYNYSSALKSHQGNWDQANLDTFLKSPRGFAPGTYMTFAGFSSDRDRRDVVAYLESLKAGASK